MSLAKKSINTVVRSFMFSFEERSEQQANECREVLHKIMQKGKKDERSVLKKEDAHNVLSQLYLFDEKQGGLPYKIKNVRNYLQDYLLFNVAAAEDFIKRSIKENPEKTIEEVKRINEEELPNAVKAMKSSGLSIESITAQVENLKVFFSNELIEKSYTVPKEIEAKALRYLGVAEDPILYNINNIEQSIHDWLTGVEPAEEFIILAMQENFREVINTVNKIETEKDSSRLLALLVKHQNRLNPEDEKLLLTVKYRKEILKDSLTPFKTAEAIASILEDADNLGLLYELISPNSSNVNSRIRILNHDVLLHIKNEKVFLKVCQYFKVPAVLLYHYGLMPNLQNKLYLFVEALKTMKLPRENGEMSLDNRMEQPVNQPSQSGVVKLEEDIRIDYYIASLSKDKEMLLELAYEKNPKMFTDLFTFEMMHGYPANLFASEDAYQILKKRQEFLIDFIRHPDMEAFTYSGLCKEALFDRFPALERTLESNQPKQKSIVPKTPISFVNDEFPDDDGKLEISPFRVSSAPTSTSRENKSSPTQFLSGLFSKDSKTKTDNAESDSKKDKKKKGFFGFSREEEEKEMADMSDRPRNDSDDLHSSSSYHLPEYK